MAEKIANDRHALHACILYEFLKGKPATAAHEELCKTLGEKVVSIRTIRNWFKKFNSGRYELDDEPRSGRPTTNSDQVIEKSLEEHPKQSVRDIAADIGEPPTTVFEHLHRLGKVPKLGYLEPHKLTEGQRDERCRTSLCLLTRSRRFDWMSCIVTSDEKWVMYNNLCRKRQWVDSDKTPEPDQKPELHGKKVLLCCWWDQTGMIYWELMPTNTTITSDVYIRQLRNLKKKYELCRPGNKQLLLLHDNARPHTAKSTRHALEQLEIEVLPHPPYSPDLAPSDYHLFHSLQNHLSGENFDDTKEVENYLTHFFDSQSPEFWKRGIESLVDRWRRVIDNDGNYLID